MTHPRSRRRQPEFRGDFPPADRDIRQGLAPWDGTTIPLSALRGEPRYTPGGPAEPYPDAFRGRPPVQPPTVAALPDFTPPAPPPVPDAPRDVLPPVPVHPGHDIIGRDTTRGWPRLLEIRCAYPAAASATPIPCGAVHRDRAATSFRALRASAYAAGWHMDAFGRMACPGCCQASGDYQTLYPVTLWDHGAATAIAASDRHAEFWFRAAKEHDLIRDVRDTARHGRHAGGTS